MPFTDIPFAALALCAVLGLIWLAQRAARAGGLARAAPASTGRLRLVQSLSLDAKRRVTLLECDGRPLILLTGGSTDVLLPSEGPGLAAPIEVLP